MARERMVTRTVDVTNVTALCMNINTCEPLHIPYQLGGLLNNIEALKAAKKRYETDDIKIVAIETLEHEEILYGMTEDMFIKMATVLPPRTNSNSKESGVIVID